MSPQSGPLSTHSQGPSPSSNKHAAILPPIIPPGPSAKTPGEPQSAGSLGLPPLSRTNSHSSNDGSNRIHHILNPANGSENGSKPPTPDIGTRQQPLPPMSLSRNVSSERPPSTNSLYTPVHIHGPPHRLSAPNLSNPTGTIDAKKSPFLPTAGSGPPMAHAPLAPTSQPYGARHGYPFPQQGLTAAAPIPRRSSDTISAHGSRTGSPTPSYSSYGQPSTAQGSPRSQFSAVTHHGAQALYHGQAHQHGSHVPQQVPSPQQMQHPHEQFPPPHHQNMMQRGAPYHMILDTEHGPIQVPMDVNTASKMADEKRKRNAGASARFRQRRKEKERESATTISKLEDKVRELSDEKDYYRAERDYFRDLVYKNEGARANLAPRLPSPVSTSDRNRQGSLTSSREGGLSPSSGGGAEYRESGDRGSDDGRILRRRISGYEPEQRAATQEEHQHQHPNHNSASTPSPQHANVHYSYQRSDSRGSAPGPSSHVPPHMQSVPQAMRTGPYETNNHPHPVHYEMRWAAPS